jgi:hypothetical protein
MRQSFRQTVLVTSAILGLSTVAAIAANSAPPVVYPPYGYYARPGVSLNLNFPIR